MAAVVFMNSHKGAQLLQRVRSILLKAKEFYIRKFHLCCIYK